MATAAKSSLEASYDQIPYTSVAFSDTHPNRLATVATLLGIDAPDVTRCRVLEIGCSMGDNLLPMADSLPESSFLGIDLSARQIEAGQELAQAAGLKNVELRHMSLMDLPDSSGPFDYIICHGVYSWVPGEVQDKILHLCANCLTEQGVAYISYNTYPGWHMRAMLREMMLYHVAQFEDPQQKVQQARHLLRFIATSVAESETPFSLLMREELERIGESSDSYVFHDFLEEVNSPLYFHQFVERAERKGLQYLGEAELNVMSPGNFTPEVEAVLRDLSADVVHLEQYMDFLRNRTFRKTLLCHDALPVSRKLHAGRIHHFLASSCTRPAMAEVDLQSDEPLEFESADGSTLTVQQPLIKSLFACLGEQWPRAIPVPELHRQARQRLGWPAPTGEDEARRELEMIGHALITAFTSRSRLLAELRVYDPAYVLAVGERPRASRLAQLQAARAAQVTNRKHISLKLDPIQRHLLMRLDGTQDRAALMHELVELVTQGTLRLDQDGRVLSQEEVRSALEQGLLEEKLNQLARLAYLVA